MGCVGVNEDGDLFLTLRGYHGKNGNLRKGKKIKPNQNQTRPPTEYVADCSIFRPLAGLGFKRLLIADGRKIAIGHTWVLESVTEPRCGVMPLVTDFP